MLERLTKKISGTIFEKVIQLHKSESNKIGINEKIDFALVFYVLHEIPHQENFFSEIISVLKPGGSILIVEPPFHVSKKSFNDYVHMAENVGLTPIEGPKILFSKSIMFRKI
jgi:ubiquinone/menaquinone biosynthesis C-methylase UbiE